MLLLRLYDYVSSLTTDDSLHQWLVHFAGHKICKKKREKWSDMVENQIELSFKILNDGGWTIEKKSDVGVITSKNVQDVGKVIKYEGIINSSIECIKDKIFYNLEKSTEWNSSLTDTKTLKKIDETSSITYSVSRSYHAVSSRDFVHLRAIGRVEDKHVLACVSIDYPEVPETSDLIRAEHKIFTYILHPAKNEPSKTHFTCLMHVNLRGWLPQALVNQTVSMGLLDHIKDIKYCTEK